MTSNRPPPLQPQMQKKLKLSSEKLVLMFINLSEQRYISGDNCLKEAENFINSIGGATLPEVQKLQAKIIILQQMRDTVPQVDPQRVFRSFEHRDEMAKAIIDACENLENKLAEIEDELAP